MKDIERCGLVRAIEMRHRLTLECFVLVGDWRLLWFGREGDGS